MKRVRVLRTDIRRATLELTDTRVAPDQRRNRRYVVEMPATFFPALVVWDDIEHGNCRIIDGEDALYDLPLTSRVEIYEDNAGTIWFCPVGQEIAIEVPATGDALTDCHLYMVDWLPSDTPESVSLTTEVDLGAMRHVATYYPGGGKTLGGGERRGRLVHEVGLEEMGHAALRYLGVDTGEVTHG